MWTAILTVGLQVLGWFLRKNETSEEMQKLFYEFIERQHNEYLNSAKMRARAKERLLVIVNKEFQESP